MFTGIVVAVGQISRIEDKVQDRRFTIACGDMDWRSVNLGDSISVNGVCLTVVEKVDDGFCADVSAETLSRSTFEHYKSGTRVNLEPALNLSTRLGGHLVSGHVDGIGEIIERRIEGRSIRFQIRVPKHLAKYIAEKGSICVDGVSLTVNAVQGDCFDINIVPHTSEKTVIQQYSIGTQVNIEVDLIARYLERLLLGERAADANAKPMDIAFLAEHGFYKADR